MIVVVMGVSGSGKTTIGRLLAERLACEFLDGDDFHPPANVAKMAAGTPLTDEDRAPWLERLNGLAREHVARGESAVLACSALKARYRERLMQGVPDCRLVYLHAPAQRIRERLAVRQHRYMPASLLDSQFAALEPPADAIAIDVQRDARACVDEVLARLAQRPGRC